MSEDEIRPAVPQNALSPSADSDPQKPADLRDHAGAERDGKAHARDRLSEGRDDDAERRDRRAESRPHDVARPEATWAAADREESRGDRQLAARDRGDAASDREAAATDRASSAVDRVVSSIDGLTGAYRRDAGMAELEREVAKAKRTRDSFVLAFVDVDGLKATNDRLGHGAGDMLLRRVVTTMREHLRSYDLVVRVGGDEFICALVNLNALPAAKDRFLLINSDLEADPAASVTVGFAELDPHDSLEDLISRADAALREQRQSR